MSLNQRTPLKRKTPLRRKTAIKPSGGLARKIKERPERPDMGKLKVSWRRSKPIRGKDVYKNKVKTQKGIVRKAKMRRVSKKKCRQMRAYLPMNSDFLQRPENRYCYICLCRSLDCTVADLKQIMESSAEESDRLLTLSGARMSPATEVHHHSGRIGRLLTFEPLFIPSCFHCREWPHIRFREARDRGLLAEAAKFNVYPEADAERLTKEMREWRAKVDQNNFEKSKKAA